MRFLIVECIALFALIKVVFSDLTSLALNGDCQFYQELDGLKNCGLNGYPIAYGFKYCKKFGDNINNFNEDGKKWVDSVRKCLMGELLNNEMNCKNLENYAFTTHVECYINPGHGSKSICDIWASQNAVGLLTTYELKDFFRNLVALSQVFTTMSKCIAYYGMNSLQFLANLVNNFNNN